MDRYFQTEIVSQRRTIIIAAGKPAATKLWQHQLGKGFQTCREDRRHYIETIRAIGFKTLFERVSHVRRRANDLQMTTRARNP